jgi:diguanylate cyclase (GGDEF)-like protein
VSIGIALYPSHGVTYDELYANADKALYKAKKAGKDTVALFE